MTIGKVRIPMMASLLLWAALWEIVGQTGASFVIPPLSHIFTRIVEIVPTKSFGEALWITGKAFLLGNFIAIVVGVPLGVIMGRSVIMDRIFLPWVNMFLSAPLTALVPVIMVIFGLGQTTIILTVVLFAIWIIVLDARAGCAGYPSRLSRWPRASVLPRDRPSRRSIFGRPFPKFCLASGWVSYGP